MSKVININDYHTLRETKKRRALYVSHREGTVTGALPKEKIAEISRSIEKVNEMMRKLKEQK